MKIALSTAGDQPSVALDSRFGRAPGFLIHDTDTKSYAYIDNTQNLNAPQGAGIQSAQNVAATGAEALITGHCGPKAFDVLRTAGIKVYTAREMTVEEAVAAFAAGELTEADGADVDSHW